MSRPLRVDYINNALETVYWAYMLSLGRGYRIKITGQKDNRFFIDMEKPGSGNYVTTTSVRGMLAPGE